MTSTPEIATQAPAQPLSRRAQRELERANAARVEQSTTVDARRDAESIVSTPAPQAPVVTSRRARRAAEAVAATTPDTAPAAPAPLAAEPVAPRRTGRRAGAAESSDVAQHPVAQAPAAPTPTVALPVADAPRPAAPAPRPVAPAPRPVAATPAVGPAVRYGSVEPVAVALQPVAPAAEPVRPTAPVATIPAPRPVATAAAPAPAPRPVATAAAPAPAPRPVATAAAPVVQADPSVVEGEIDLPLSFKRNQAALQPVASGRGSTRAFVRVKRSGASKGPKRRGAVVRGAAGVAALGFAASVAVSSTLPANAVTDFQNESVDGIAGTEAGAAQSLTVASSTTQDADVDRDEGYAVATMGTATAYNMAYGIKRPDPNAYTNDLTAAVQWPFPVGTIISDYFGGRVSPCAGCSSNHKGVDFTPGEGTPIGSIAAGRVKAITPTDNGGLGVHVIVEHVIDGQVYESVYGHMLVGSIAVQVGQIVNVGDELGKVGNTGSSTGAHLHLEVHTNNDKIDPFAFLQSKNNSQTVVQRPDEGVSA